jgi:hypothetical protein
LRISDFPFPADNFIDDVKNNIQVILVSYRNSKRLITQKKNKYLHSKNAHEQNSSSVRGTLHEETYYGKIFHPITGEEVFVTRKPINSLDKIKQIDKIVDPTIKKIIRDHIEAIGGDEKIKQALSIPLFINSNDGLKKIPIKKVRVIDSAVNMIPLNKNTFVSSGNNYCIGIYEYEGKRIYRTVSFFQAVKLYSQKQPILPEVIGNYKCLIQLKQNDLAVVYNKHADEINWDDRSELFNSCYRVIKFDNNGVIVLGLHNLSNLKADRDSAPYILRKTYNTFKGIKINLNILGRIYHDKEDSVLR